MSSQEVQNLILKRVEELTATTNSLREKMHAEHRELGERVSKLESNQKILLWLVAPACVAAGAVLREIIVQML